MRDCKSAMLQRLHLLRELVVAVQLRRQLVLVLVLVELEGFLTPFFSLIPEKNNQAPATLQGVGPMQGTTRMQVQHGCPHG